jgi:hypothetical protein
VAVQVDQEALHLVQLQDQMDLFRYLVQLLLQVEEVVVLVVIMRLDVRVVQGVELEVTNQVYF